MSETYFIDSNIFISLANANDSLHNKAKKLLPILQNNDCIISTYVIDEVITVVGNKSTVENAMVLFNFLKSNKFKLIEESDVKDFEYKIMLNYEKYNRGFSKKKRLSYTDCSILVIMEEFGIENIISYDRQFERCGNVVLINNL